MRGWIAGAMSVLGVLLVLAGAGAVVLRTLSTPASADATSEVTPAGGRTRLVRAMRDMPDSYRLICWGVVLLVLAAIAAGAIGINLDANAGTR
jgi:uncharacterized membrane protein